MGRLSAQNQMLIGIGIVAVLAVLAVVLVILPTFQKATAIDAQIATEQTNLDTAKALLARRQSAKAQSAASETELMRIANEIPDTPQLPSVIIEIQDMANLSGVALEKITPSDVVAAKGDAQNPAPQYGTVPLSLSLQGDWTDMIDFHRRLANLNRGVRIVSSSFTYVPGTDGETPYIDAKVDIAVYVMAAASGSGPSESATSTVPAK